MRVMQILHCFKKLKHPKASFDPIRSVAALRSLYLIHRNQAWQLHQASYATEQGNLDFCPTNWHLMSEMIQCQLFFYPQK